MAKLVSNVYGDALFELAVETGKVDDFLTEAEGVIEVVKIGQQIIESNRLTVPTASIAVYFVIFMMYFFVCWILSLAARAVEKQQKK